MTLDAWCAAIARAYPEPVRAAEVRTTLAESNEGRRRPRVGDVADVLWHGLAARLRSTAPGTRFGRWGDAVSVAAVLGLLVHATTAVALYALAFRGQRYDIDAPPNYVPYNRVRFTDPSEAVVGGIAVAVAIAAAFAACRGWARLTRALAVGAGLGLASLYAVQRALGQDLSYLSWAGKVALLGSLAVGTGVVLTSAVSRAAAVVPRWWWAFAAVAGVTAGLGVVWRGPHPYGHGRASVVMTAYVAEAFVLLLLAMPLAARWPLVPAGAALLAVPAAPLLMYGGESWLLMVPFPGLVGIVAVVLAAPAALTLRRR